MKIPKLKLSSIVNVLAGFIPPQAQPGLLRGYVYPAFGGRFSGVSRIKREARKLRNKRGR